MAGHGQTDAPGLLRGLRRLQLTPTGAIAMLQQGARATRSGTQRLERHDDRDGTAHGMNPHQRPARVYVEQGELPFEALVGTPLHQLARRPQRLASWSRS